MPMSFTREKSNNLLLLKESLQIIITKNAIKYLQR